MPLSDAIIILLIGSVSSLVGLTLRYCYLSKCKVVRCCGICEIDRTVELEQVISGGNQTPNNNI